LKKCLIIFLSVILLFSLVGCSEIARIDPTVKQPPKIDDYPVAIDSLQFNECPKAVVVLSPALTEIIYEIGAGDKLIARSDYCEYPAEVSQIPSVGSPAKPDINGILSLKPDLLITQSPIAEIDLNVLELSGIKVLTISPPKTFYELVDTYAKLSLIFLGNNSADKMTTERISPLDSALYKAQGMNYTDNFVFIMTQELAVATGDSLSGSILSVFGNNIAKDYTKFTMPVADIVAADPSVIFISKDVDISALPEEIANLPAIINGKVITIDYSLFERPTSRISAVIEDIIPQMDIPVGTSQTDESSTIDETSSEVTP